MPATVPFSPFATSNASGSFNVESTGYVQGASMDDPAMRNQLAGGVLASDEVLPMWGGIGIYNDIPGGAVGEPGAVLGGLVGRANTLTAAAAKQLVGFSVFDQAHHMIQSPQSQVPIAVVGMGVHFYRLGSLARIPVAVDPALISLQGSIITSQISWDFGGQQLTAGTVAYPANVITAASWASTGGGQATYTTTSGHTVPVGEYITISGMTPNGYNGTFKTIAGTTGSTIVVAMPVDPGASTVQGTLVAGGGILPVKILDVRATNCMVVQYNALTGQASWNRNGACALIQI